MEKEELEPKIKKVQLLMNLWVISEWMVLIMFNQILQSVFSSPCLFLVSNELKIETLSSGFILTKSDSVEILSRNSCRWIVSLWVLQLTF